MNKIKNIAQLIVKNFIGELTEDESRQLKLWLNNPANVDLHERILNSVSFNRKREILKKSEQYKHEISAKINRRVKLRKLRFISSVAASIIFASLLIYAIIPSNSTVESKIASLQIQEMPLPILMLPDGETKILSKQENSNVYSDEEVTVNNDSGILNFKQTNKELPQDNFCRIETPAGCDYKLKLSDGTLVHLNAKSKLTFQNVFKGNHRTVHLEGQAYFDVAHNKEMPFIVRCNNMDIKVLGTRFDVKSYDDDREVSATLFNGKIEANIFGKGKRTLSPEQKIVYNKENSDFNILTIDESEYIGWRQGIFHFIDERLEDIMTEVSRWYDVEIFFESEEIKNMRMGVYCDNDKSIDDLLNKLEKTGDLKFIIKGKAIFIR